MPDIRSDIPMPSRKGPRSVLGRLISELKPGQSFISPLQRESVYSLARYYGIRVAIRTVDGEMHVWRVDNQHKPTNESEK